MTTTFDIVSQTARSDDGPACPYCGREFTTDDKSYYLEEFHMWCDECKKSFRVTTYHETTWTSHQIGEK